MHAARSRSVSSRATAPAKIVRKTRVSSPSSDALQASADPPYIIERIGRHDRFEFLADRNWLRQSDPIAPFCLGAPFGRPGVLQNAVHGLKIGGRAAIG